MSSTGFWNEEDVAYTKAPSHNGKRGLGSDALFNCVFNKAIESVSTFCKDVGSGNRLK